MKRDKQFEQLEADVHQALTPWIEEFGQRTGGRFYDLGYDPAAYPQQRLDIPYTPPREYPSWVPDKLVMYGLKRALRDHLGSADKLNEALEVLRETPATAETDLSIAQDLQRRIEAGEAVGVLVDHTQESDLRDVAMGVGLLVYALGNIRYRQNAAVLIGLNMSRQGYRGDQRWWQLRQSEKTVTGEVTKALGLIWVMQNSNNRRKMNIPERGTRTVNVQAGHAIKDLSSSGLLLGIVPSGTANKLQTNEQGQVESVRQEIEPESFAVFTRMDSLLPFGMHKGKIMPGKIHQLTASAESRPQRQEKIAVLDAALHELAQNNAKLMKLPVRYKNSKGETVVVLP